MVNRDKRASLTASLLDSKDAAPSRKSGLSRVNRAAVGDTARGKERENVLSNKGAASASGFRPWYWSYQQDGKTPPAHRKSEPAAPSSNEPSAAAIAATLAPRPADTDESPHIEVKPLAALAKPPRKTSTVTLTVVLSCIALVLSGAIYVAAGPRRPGDEFKAMLASRPVADVPSPQDIAALIARGDQLLAAGDVAVARYFYERAAEQGSAVAATAVGNTYDPLFLVEIRARGVRGDAAMAAEWYRKASLAGDRQADIRLKRLTEKLGG